MHACLLSCFSHVWTGCNCANSWTVARQAPHPWDSPGKNTGVGCHSLLQGIFPSQGWNLHLMSPALAGGSLSLAPAGKPKHMAAAAAKSLQSCPTLCDPIDGSPPGSPVPGILQATTLEWVAISFSNAWEWKVKGKLLSRVWLLATPWTAAYQSPPSMGFSRQEYWSGVPSPSPKHIAFISKYQTLLWGADLYILTHSILTLTLWVIFTISILQIWKIRQREINLFCATELKSAGAKIQIKAIFLCPWLHCTIEWNIYTYAHIYGIP